MISYEGSAMDQKDLEVMLAEWNTLAERYNILKEALLRPIRDARNIPLGSRKDYGQALREAKVLPEHLYESMAFEYQEAEKALEILERQMGATNRFSFGEDVCIVSEGFWG